MVNRAINPSKNSSFFLFGARGTGKSTWLAQRFGKGCLWIDLLDAAQEEAYSLNPKMLSEILDRMKKVPEWVIIDEVQKCPKLLDRVHLEIEKRKIKFALTGSSSRRLKQRGVNLLAGRAFTYSLFPLTSLELGRDFSLSEILQYGSLPHLLSFKETADKQRYLRSYVLNYIQLEVQAEQWVRKLDPFRKFLPVVAQMNGKIINYSKIAEDIGVDTTTVQSYYEILLDTLMGFEVEPFHRSIRKRQRHSPKFYLFDLGIKASLDGTVSSAPVPGTSLYGDIFEHFVICEILRLSSYKERHFGFSYLRTKDDAEIDLVLEMHGEPIRLIEIKSKNKVDERDCRSLERFAREFQTCQPILISQDKTNRKISGVDVLYWTEALNELGVK